MQVIKERHYQGTIDPMQHWLDEIRHANNSTEYPSEVSRASINCALAQLEKWKAKQGGRDAIV